MHPATRVQLCGPLLVELTGRPVTLPGRQGRLLFAYLVLHRPRPVPREQLAAALWGDAPPPAAGSALNALISRVRAATGPSVLRGRSELAVDLPPAAVVDVETAVAAVHRAESAVAVGEWRRAWSAALTGRFVAARPFLPEATLPWAEARRAELGEVYARALECYATACLGIGGAELPGAERAARDLVAAAPLRETGHLLLMRSLAARGNVAEALAAYERLRVRLRDELGVDPCAAVRDAHAALLRLG
ncbi:BTAD domain-containing putative transcriptional regulator [Asanoa sp. WMMD1127]|uniref:AfsR/SARP family transcriptional regulator n=1 Tax=Asanoa sp. WMMD1127 TaxID=3016107 RepID=UPI002417EA4B|nr:BTAD domain-containing putative transcriptional regulator [Asanoa sp. WMMD1127]MDG4824239.1 BTAD domain-containing putative transcriptional regulator [Asanoa sp. WMMD1127]